MKKVLSIIVSYNFEPWLDKCLSSLLESSYPTDVLVVDNASQDHSAARIRQAYPQVKLIESRENLGFGKANNLGFRYALEQGYDTVFLVNQDAWLKAGCLSELMEQDYPEDIGIISPVHYDGTEQALDQGFAHYTQALDLHAENAVADFVNAAFWLIPTKILREIGGFSSIFYHYGEDSDYVNRLHYHGYQLVINTKATAYHDRQGRLANQSVEALRKSEFVYFLTEYANINNSFSKAFAYAVLAALKKAFQALPKNTKICGMYATLALQLLRKTNAVRRTRRQNKLFGISNWLGE